MRKHEGTLLLQKPLIWFKGQDYEHKSHIEVHFVTRVEHLKWAASYLNN